MSKEHSNEKRLNRFLEKVRQAQELKEKKKREATSRAITKQYLKKKAEAEKARQKKGDVHNWYNVLITRNKRKFKTLHFKPWKTDAYLLYSQEIKNNVVDFPVMYEKDRFNTVHPVKYELLLIEHIDPTFKDTTSLIRNEYGKFVEHTVVGKDAQIVDKHNFYFEEDFYVYGFHPIKERKTFSYILNEILLKTYNEFIIKRVYIFSNKVIIKSDKDLNIITCKNTSDSRRLYNLLLTRSSGKKFIFFNYTPLDWSSPIMDEVRELTGWNKNMLVKGNW